MLEKKCPICGLTKSIAEFLDYERVRYKGRPVLCIRQRCRCCADVYKKLTYSKNLIRITKDLPLEDLGILAELLVRGWEILVREAVPIPDTFKVLFKDKVSKLDLIQQVKLTKITQEFWRVTCYCNGYTRHVEVSMERFFELLNGD